MVDKVWRWAPGKLGNLENLGNFPIANHRQMMENPKQKGQKRANFVFLDFLPTDKQTRQSKENHGDNYLEKRIAI